MYIVKTRKCLEYRLNRAIKRGRLLNIEDVARQIGKTHLLVKKARELDAIIIEPNIQCVAFFKKIYPDVEFMSVKGMDRFMGYRRGVLLDEGIPLETERNIRRYFKIIGGYTGNSNTMYVYIKDGLAHEIL